MARKVVIEKVYWEAADLAHHATEEEALIRGLSRRCIQSAGR